MAGRKDLIFRRIADAGAQWGDALNFNLDLMEYALANPFPLAAYEDPQNCPDPKRWPWCLIYVRTSGSHPGARFKISDGAAWRALDGTDAVMTPPSGGWAPDFRSKPEIPLVYAPIPESRGWGPVVDGWFALASMMVQAPLPLPVYERANLPDPDDWRDHMIFVSDGPSASGGPFTLDQKLRMSVFQNYGAGNESRWIGLDGSTTNTDMPGGGWKDIGAQPSKSFSTIFPTSAFWGTILEQQMAQWRDIFARPLYIKTWTIAAFNSATYGANPNRWRHCLGIITNPAPASSPVRADERLAVSQFGAGWQRFRDTTNPL